MERSVGAQQEAAATEATQASFGDVCDKGWRCRGTKERKAMKKAGERHARVPAPGSL